MVGWIDGWVVGIGNKAQLRPAQAGAGAWPELGNYQITISTTINTNHAEGHCANARSFYLTSLSNFIVTRVIPLHQV